MPARLQESAVGSAIDKSCGDHKHIPDTEIVWTEQDIDNRGFYPRKTLQYLRSVGGGPPFAADGGRVRYRKCCFISWWDAHTVGHTSETPQVIPEQCPKCGVKWPESCRIRRNARRGRAS